MAYGTLKLLPDVVDALTPGQITDMVLGRVWVQERQREEAEAPSSGLGRAPGTQDAATRAAAIEDLWRRKTAAAP